MEDGVFLYLISLMGFGKSFRRVSNFSLEFLDDCLLLCYYENIKAELIGSAAIGKDGCVMLKKILCWILLVAMVLPLLPKLSFEARAATYTSADWAALRNNWKVSIVGDDSIDWDDPEIKKIVGKTNSSGLSSSGISYNGGKYWMDLEKNRSNSGRIFGSSDITITVASDTMRKQFVYVMYMAKAYGTKGAVYTYKDNGTVVTKELYQNQELRNAIFYALEKGTSFYNYDFYKSQRTSSTAKEYYNWWDYAFGAPDEILQTLLIMYPYKTTAEKNTANKIIDTCRTLIDELRPNNDGKTDEDTLSYRRTRLRICGMIAALKEDTALIEQTRTNLINFLANNDGGNGVQDDNSYRAHDHFAYEGTYGTSNLCDRIIESYSVMSGTAFAPTASNKHNQMDWILKTFMPVMHNGVMLLQSNGRYPSSGLGYGRAVIRAALLLIDCFEEEDNLQLIRFIREIVVKETETETYNAYSTLAVALGSVPLVQTLKEVVYDYDLPMETNVYADMRPSTDRAVQHREDYTVGLAMSSRRTATPESINGANRYGWYTGDGALYIYNDKTNTSYDQYGSDFNVYANMYRVPGTTEENSTTRKPVSQQKAYYPGMTYTSSGWVQATNKDGVDAGAFVGGVEMDETYIAAAYDFEAYSWSSAESTVEKNQIKNPVERNNIKQAITSDLTAKKSYFMFDNEIVCVGSDIDFSTRTSSVYTYVDNRELLEKTTVDGVTTYGTDDIIVDGNLLEKVNSFSTKKYTDPSWIYAENFGGYVFPKGGNVTLKKAYRESSNDGDDTNDSFNKMTTTSTTPNGKHSFLEVWIDHGSKPVDGSYSYVMLPNMTAEETQAYSATPDISIAKNTTSLHVVKENTLGITAMVFWKAGTYGDITVDKPMILMVKETNGMYTLSACDPTQELTTATITINRALNSWDIHSKMTVSGTSKITVKVNFTGSKGATYTSEFAIENTQQLLFDFANVNSGKYHNSLYGYKNYAKIDYWATARVPSSGLKVSGGKLTVPLTTEKDSNGDPKYWQTYIQPSDSKTNFAWNSGTSNNFLNFDASNAEIFQIRLKLDGVTQYGTYDAGVYLTYFPKGQSLWSGTSDTTFPWKEIIKLTVPKECLKGGSLEGEYVTLTYDLSSKKISTCGTIAAVCFQFGYMVGGTATVDHIYIGRKTDSLYFGFRKDASLTHHVEGAYGGHDYDDAYYPTWATACTDQVGGYYELDPVEGYMTFYTGSDYEGTAADPIYGAYFATTSNTKVYATPKVDESLPLSYDPSQAEILEIRFKTEGLVAQEGKEPRLVVASVLEKGSNLSENYDSSVPLTIRDGQWQTLRIPLADSVKAADYLKSVGVRFLHTRSQSDGAIAKITVDYIYVGKQATSPAVFLVDFKNDEAARERYITKAHGGFNLDVGGWINSSRITAPTFSAKNEGTMTFSLKTDATQGVFYVQCSPNISKPFAMDYVAENAEVIQYRFKIKNMKGYSDPRATLYFYSANKSHYNGTDTIKNAAVEVYRLSEKEMTSDSYITVTVPVSNAVKAAEKITALRFNINGAESISSTQSGQVTVDYIYVGPKAYAPTGCATVTFLHEDGTVLATETVVKGTAATYTGAKPMKESTEDCHYLFTGWDTPLDPIQEDLTVTAQFTAEAHSYTEGLCTCGAKEAPMEPVEDSSLKLSHSLNLASDISVNFVVLKTALADFDLSTVYAECVVDSYTGNEKIGTTTYTLQAVEQGYYYYFTLTGLTAVRMNDRIRTVLYGQKDGRVYYSPMDDYSIADYAYAQLNKDNVAVKLKTLCADLLRYGTAAQLYKGYRTDALVDSAMTEAHKTNLSDLGAVTFGDLNRTLSDLDAPKITWAGKSLNLESKVTVRYVISIGAYEGTLEDLSLCLSYIDRTGQTRTVVLTELTEYNAAYGLYTFDFDGLLAAELRTVLSAQVYAGQEPVSVTLEYSPDTYGKGKTGTLGALCTALFAYSDSAKKYFS